MELTSPTPPCLSCRERAAQCRGLCPACNSRLSSAVGRGATTWAALEADGQAPPAKRPGRHFPPKEGR